jgi:hypothetical protein
MYANGGEPQVGDGVRRINGSDEGVVEKLVPGGLNGEEVVQVRWTTLHEISPGSGIKMPKAPSVIPTRHIEFVSHG